MCSYQSQQLEIQLKTRLLDFYDIISGNHHKKIEKKRFISVLLNKVIYIPINQKNLESKTKSIDQTDFNSPNSSEKHKDQLLFDNHMHFTFNLDISNAQPFAIKNYSLDVQSEVELIYQTKSVDRMLFYAFFIQYKLQERFYSAILKSENKKAMVQDIKEYFKTKYQEIKQAMVSTAYQLRNFLSVQDYKKIKNLYQCLKIDIDEKQNSSPDILKIITDEFSIKYMRLFHSHILKKREPKMMRVKSLQIKRIENTKNDMLDNEQNQFQRLSKIYGIRIRLIVLNQQTVYGEKECCIEVLLQKYQNGSYQLRQIDYFCIQGQQVCSNK